VRKIALLYVLVTLVLVGGCSSGSALPDMPEATPVTTEPEIIEISALELHTAYVANHVAADENYKGKLLEITGPVSFRAGIMGNLYIYVGSGALIPSWGVQCVFSDSVDPRLEEIRKHDEVRVRGRCEGQLGDIVLQDCTLLYLVKKEG
jgi:hypothetical protein